MHYFGVMSPASTPHLSGAPTAQDRARWVELLEQLDPDALVETFITLVTRVPDYDPPPVPLSELRRTAHLTFVSLVEQLKTGEEPAITSVAVELGVSRARAGLPIESLLTAIRLDFTVLWEALTRVAGPEDAELLVRYTATILNTVDDYIVQTQQSYVAELQRMQSEATSVMQWHIAQLFRGTPPTGEHLEAVAAGLGVPLDAEFRVVAAVGDDIAPLRVFISDAERLGLTVYTTHLEDALIAFFRRQQLPQARQEELERRVLALRVGTLRTEGGLLEVRDAARTARELARLINSEDTAAITWRQGWARVARQQLLAANHPVLSDVQAALARCGSSERARLTEAVSSYLTTGSIGESAARLFCHRNTLANRLRRFAELTGVDPLVPEQAARLVVGWA